ncbi:Xaa-Pro peptidase family protein [Inquilinus sp. CAU 1745]|uniref:M24 family metallopeptidase n=1 Tax=Inquilinus sp. CAU 1745 TaxID=3140369 RepID=UPI00325BFA57
MSGHAPLPGPLPVPNERRLDLERLARLREQVRAHDCGAVLLYDPTNIRYATGVSNMQVYSLHNPCRYVFVPAEGPVVLFDFFGCEHLSAGKAAVDEVRPAVSWYHFIVGDRVREKAAQWAAEIADLVTAHGAGNRRIAVDRLDPAGLWALEALNVQVADGQEVANHARRIKTPEEMLAIRAAVANCETGMRRMADALRPGITELALWSHLHQSNIEMGGEWIETRLLTSGPRTNPWYQECSDRVIEDGDIVAFDTDLIGAYGYSADISRSWVAGDGRAGDEQRRLYEAAFDQVTSNILLFRPGATFEEIAMAGRQLPERYRDQTNSALAHGIGLCNEYPLIVNRQYWEDGGIDGAVEAGMVFCVESFAGEKGGREGVKLEQQILVTETGPELLSTHPLEETLM